MVKKDLQQSTGNSTQYSVVIYMGKESGTELLYVTCLSLCCTSKTNIVNQLYCTIKFVKKKKKEKKGGD